MISNGVYLFTFMCNVALVRMLLPEHFGTVALSLSLVGLVEIVTTFAFNTVLFQHRDRASLFRCIFQFALIVTGLKLVIGVILYLGITVPYGTETGYLFALMLASKIFAGIGPLLVARLEKRGDFVRATLISSGATVLAVSVAVVAVYAGAGVYGLALREILPPVLVFLAMLIAHSDLWPRDLKQIDRRQLRVVAGAATRLYFQRGAELAYMRIPLLIVESVFGATVLGLLTQATYLVTLVNRITSYANQQIATVFFSHNRRAAREAKRGFLLLLAINVAVALPVTGLLWIFPQEIVLFLWGKDWVGAVPYLRVMAAMTLLLPLFTLLKSRLLGMRLNHAITLVYLTGLAFLTGGLWVGRDAADAAVWIAGLTTASYAIMMVLCGIFVRFSERTRQILPPVIGAPGIE